MGIIDEYLGSTGIGVEGGRNAADVIAVAEGKQGQNANRSMLNGVQSTGQVQSFFLQPCHGPRGQVKPQRHRGKVLRRQIKGFLTDYLLGELRLLFEADYGGGNLHLTQEYLYLSVVSIVNCPGNV